MLKSNSNYIPMSHTVASSSSSLLLFDAEDKNEASLPRDNSFASLELSRPSSRMSMSFQTTKSSHEASSSSSAVLFHSPTMAQMYWGNRYFESVCRLIAHPAPSVGIIKLLLGPKLYAVNQQHKYDWQEKAVEQQHLLHEREFYGRLLKTICHVEEKLDNENILKEYEEKVIKVDEQKIANYKNQIMSQALTAAQQEEFKQCQLRCCEFKLVSSQHKVAARAFAEDISKYHKMIQEKFKEEKDSKSATYLTLQEQITSYGQHRSVGYQKNSKLFFTEEKEQLKNLKMQLEYTVGKRAFIDPLSENYKMQLIKNLQRIQLERASDLHLDSLSPLIVEEPHDIHENFLLALGHNFFDPSLNKSYEVFLTSRDVRKFKQFLQEKEQSFALKLTSLAEEKQTLDCQFSEILATNINDYRKHVENCMKYEGDRAEVYLPRLPHNKKWTVDKIIDDIKSSGVHTYPLRRIRDAESGNGLLHFLMNAYVFAMPTARGNLLIIFEELLQRGADLLAENKTGLTPFAYGNSFLRKSDAQQLLPDWDLLKIAFKYHPTTNSTQKNVKQAALHYFDKQQSFLRQHFSVFYNQRISQVTRREQMEMALLALVDAVKQLQDSPLKNMLKSIDAMPVKKGALWKGLRKAIPEDEESVNEAVVSEQKPANLARTFTPTPAAKNTAGATLFPAVSRGTNAASQSSNLVIKTLINSPSLEI